MSAISDYFEGDAFLNYTKKRVSLNKNFRPSLSKSEKKELITQISLLLNRNTTNDKSSLINQLVEAKKKEIEDDYIAAITVSSGRARTKFYPLDPFEQNLTTISNAITRMLKSYSSWGGQQISKIKLKIEGENIGTIKDQLDSLNKQLTFVTHAPTSSNIKSVVDYYNYLVQLLEKFTPINALAQGDFFEAVVAMADQLKNTTAEELAYQDVLEAIQKTIVGAKVEGKKDNSAKTSRIDKNGSEGKGIASQGKIDVILTRKKDKNKLKPIGASVKSYSSFKNITLESGTSMRKILMGEDINYSTAVLLGLAASEKAQVFNKAKESFEMLAYYKALTGDYYGRKKASLFVLNNVKTKKVYIVEMSELLKDAYEHELKNKSVFRINPDNYYSVLQGLNNYDDLIAAQSKQALKVIFSSSGTTFNRLKSTVSG